MFTISQAGWHPRRANVSSSLQCRTITRRELLGEGIPNEPFLPPWCLADHMPDRDATSMKTCPKVLNGSFYHWLKYTNELGMVQRRWQHSGITDRVGHTAVTSGTK